MAPSSSYGWGTEEFLDCPYPAYRQLLDEAPVHRLPATNTYVVSRWADITFVAQNPELFQVVPHAGEPHCLVDFPTIKRYVAQPASNTNGPDHRIKRAWLARLVQRDRLHSYESLVRAVADELIDAFVDRGRCEFRREFAQKLPANVIMDLLGLPREDIGVFMPDAAPADGPGNDRGRNSHEYMAAEIRKRLEAPTDDFLSEILWEQVTRDATVDIDYQVAEACNLVGAASETTAHLLTSTMLMLGRDRALIDQVTADRSLLAPLIEEAMRLESPVQWLPRTATDEVVVGGVTIPRGSTVLLVWGAGNRDPEKWPDQDEVRLDRPGVAQNQLGFGRGPHLCVGAPLARLEAVGAFDRLLTRLSDLEVLEEQSDLGNISKASGGLPFLHGPTTLQLSFAAG